MEIKATTQNARVAVSIMQITGKIDSLTHSDFQKQADELIDNSARFILVDFAHVEYISSAGLRVLHNIFNKLRTLHQDVNDDELRKKMSTGGYKSPYIKVANLSSQIREIFEISGFETYIEVFDDTDKALASFS